MILLGIVIYDNYNTGRVILDKIVQEAQPTSQQTSSQESDSMALQLHTMINDQRAQYGLPDLSYNDQLAALALAHSNDMATNNYFNHIDLRGLNPIQRAAQMGVTCYQKVAENIGWASGYPEDNQIENIIVNDWMNSPIHRANILGSHQSEGMGVATSADGKTYVTEDFC